MHYAPRFVFRCWASRCQLLPKRLVRREARTDQEKRERERERGPPPFPRSLERREGERGDERSHTSVESSGTVLPSAQPKHEGGRSEQSSMTSVSARVTILCKNLAVDNFHERNCQRSIQSCMLLSTYS